MAGFWRTAKSYFWWTHQRGNIHYDVMVTFLLLFIFRAPYKINFRDKPAALARQPNQITAYSDPHGGVVHDVPAAALSSDSRRGQGAVALTAELVSSHDASACGVDGVRL